MRAQFVFHEVWIGLKRNLTMTVALVVVVAISLSLLGTGLLFVKQVDNTRTFWQGRFQPAVHQKWPGHPRRDIADPAGTDRDAAGLRHHLPVADRRVLAVQDH